MPEFMSERERYEHGALARLPEIAELLLEIEVVELDAIDDTEDTK